MLLHHTTSVAISANQNIPNPLLNKEKPLGTSFGGYIKRKVHKSLNLKNNKRLHKLYSKRYASKMKWKTYRRRK